MTQQKLLLTTHLSAGDIVTLTAAVRDIHRAHPGKYRVNVATNVMEVWDNNPYLDRSITKSNADRVIEMHYTDAINKCNQDRGAHFITGYIGHLAKALGVEIPLTEFKPDLHFSKREINNPILPELEGKEPYWVMFAGGKTDYTAKWWHQKKFAEVVSRMPHIKFVQVGASGGDKWNPEIPGAIHLTGNTSFRALVRLILGSHGVLCPVTCGLHIAAALEKPCVILAGGREGWWWEQYEGQVYLHTIGGGLPCCKEWSCWRSHVDISYVGAKDGNRVVSDDERRSKVCLNVVDKDGQKQPACLDAISVDRVVSEINNFQETVPYRPANEFPDFVPYHPENDAIKSRVAILVNLYGNDRGSVLPTIKNRRNGEVERVPTLTYSMLHRRCIRSIVENTDLSKVNLYVSCCDVDDSTAMWLHNDVRGYVEGAGGALTVVEHRDVGKYDVMADLVNHLNIEDIVIWFDDDSYVTSDRWLERVLGRLNECDSGLGPFNTVSMYGKLMSSHSIRGEWELVQSAKWFSGVPPLLDGKAIVYTYPDGAFFVTSAALLKSAQLSSKIMSDDRGDVMLGEACRQHLLKMKDLFIGGDIGIVVNGATRRTTA